MKGLPSNSLLAKVAFRGVFQFGVLKQPWDKSPLQNSGDGIFQPAQAYWTCKVQRKFLDHG